MRRLWSMGLAGVSLGRERQSSSSEPHRFGRGPALGGYFSGVSVGLSIRRPSAASTRFTFASRPLAVGQSYAARQAA
eukprot:scaffold6207_cov46-Phaeocystis_antarctica.AAC.1